MLILMILLHVLLHSRINENSRPCIGVNTHISTPTVFPKPGSIKWQFYFSGTYDAFLARQEKFEKYYLEMKKEGQEYPDPDELKSELCKKKKHCWLT